MQMIESQPMTLNGPMGPFAPPRIVATVRVQRWPQDCDVVRGH
jgi:hypothetical protein